MEQILKIVKKIFQLIIINLGISNYTLRINNCKLMD